MKKNFNVLLILFCFIVSSFAVPINSKVGYKELSWGSSVDDAKKAGYSLTGMTSSSDKEYLSKLYIVDVSAYNVVSKDKTVSALQFHYYGGKLFAVTEMLNISELSPQKLESRYGNFNEQGIYQVGDQYMDAKLEVSGAISKLSIIISKSAGKISTVMYDWNVYKNISFTGKKLTKTEKKTITDELSPLANKLVQEKTGQNKPSFAFMALTTDYKNTLVDNYVTDALTEAMFNTGKVKIIERANLESILKEQKFQSSGLVNEETVKSIGMIAGVDFVCYGTLKDLGDTLTVNARVVDVETGELCAISRATVTKDDYLKNQVKGAVETQKAITTTTTNSTTAMKIVGGAEEKKVISKLQNAWQVTKYDDEFGGFTHYIFTINSSDFRKLFVSFKKCSNSANNRLIAGVHWSPQNEGLSWENTRYNRGVFDFKGKSGNTITKELWDVWKCPLDASEKNYFLYGWNQKLGSRWLFDLMKDNDYVSVRHEELTRRFQTFGLLDKMAEYGITWEEIDSALASEEF